MFHKNPYGSRYITAGNKCATSYLSELVAESLKFLLKYARSSPKYRFKGVFHINNIAIIDNTSPVIKLMKVLNKSHEGKKSVRSYDFSTLYTSIPHDHLKSKMKTFVESTFNCQKERKPFIVISNKWTHFSAKRIATRPCYTSGELLELIYFIIENSYILFESKVFRQVLGIPMGTNCAPYLATIFLHVFEYEYLSSLINNGKIDIAEKLSYMLRFQDDIIIFNGDSEFDKHYKLIYPQKWN